MSAADKAMRARVEGRNKTAARTMWTVLIGDRFALRCLARDDGRFDVQVRGPNGWQPLFPGDDPLAMLRAVSTSKTVEGALAALREAGR